VAHRLKPVCITLLTRVALPSFGVTVISFAKYTRTGNAGQ